ncbi:MAG: metallophosphoesterase family protein [Myxococcota bacterium]
MGLLLLACASPEPEPAGDDAPSTEATDPGPMAPLFSFVVLADPHVSAAEASENEARLAAAVEWIAENAEARDVAVVILVGDIAWDDGFDAARAVLDTLPVPWVPVLGDNEIQFGDEEAFDAAFASQYAGLAQELDGWQRGTTPVDNPEIGAPSWIQDFSFDIDGVHFVGLDWCTRHLGGIEGEMADLHDFDGGTLRWLEDDLHALPEGPSDRVAFFSHHPMHLSPGAFDLAEIEALDALLATWDDAIYANFAGHYHVNGEEVDTGRPLDVYVTDATWDDAIDLRVVSVEANAAEVRWTHEIVGL